MVHDVHERVATYRLGILGCHATLNRAANLPIGMSPLEVHMTFPPSKPAGPRLAGDPEPGRSSAKEYRLHTGSLASCDYLDCPFSERARRGRLSPRAPAGPSGRWRQAARRAAGPSRRRSSKAEVPVEAARGHRTDLARQAIGLPARMDDDDLRKIEVG